MAVPNEPLTLIADPRRAPTPPVPGVAAVGTVAIETHGCKLNQADSAVLAGEFARAGYRIVGSNADADIIVVNTCTVTATADSKARQALRAARRSNPGAVVVAAGCYPQRAADELRRMPEVSLVVGNQDKPQLTTLALAALAAQRGGLQRAAIETPGETVTGMGRRSRAMVKIQEGCDQVCAYCIVPKVRGRERSISPDVLVDSVRQHVADGFKEVVLTGTQLGTYGFEFPDVDLAGLLDRLLAETDVPRLRVSSLQAHEISADLLTRWNDFRLCPHFHVPLQSGCDVVLRAMRRRYDTATFRQAVELIRRTIPDAGVTADIIVGFPGETEADHAESQEFAAEMWFADIHVFPYSQRPGTSAHHFQGQVEAADKRRRAAAMAEVKDAGFTAFRRGLIGQVRDVLWETARPVGDEGLRWRGLTDNYVRVETTSHAELGNRITPARLTGMVDGVMTAELL